jgi:uncharacterized protein (TIGR03663 family)
LENYNNKLKKATTLPDGLQNVEREGQQEDVKSAPATEEERSSEVEGVDSLEEAESTLAAAEKTHLETTVIDSIDRVEGVEDEMARSEKKQRWRLHPPSTPEELWTMIAFWAVILLGAVLRFWDLGAKPLHWDESLHAYYSMQLLHNNIENWAGCLNSATSDACYSYNPLLHGPFQFHVMAFVYLIGQMVGAPDHGINTTTARIAAAILGTIMIGLPYFLRQYLGKVGAWIASFLIAVSPSLVYYSRFAREDIYMATFTLLLIISVVQYVRTHKLKWAIAAGLAFVLSYATKEATFLSIGVFGSFAGALLVWELVTGLVRSSSERDMGCQSDSEYFFDRSSANPPPRSLVVSLLAPIFGVSVLLNYFGVVGLLAIAVLGLTKDISIFVNSSPANMNVAQNIVRNVKNFTFYFALPASIILLAVVVFIILLLEERAVNEGKPRTNWLAARVDAVHQRFLHTIVSMPWTHWFFTIVFSWLVFMVLFTALFTNMMGLADGIWQGLFYWITQQTVERGGQPWYYYFMLIPLYEQIGLVFALVGIVYSLFRPTRFRLFLIYWFIGNFFIYSWAGEKMPWLVIHITMPMMLLAAIGLRPIVEQIRQFIQGARAKLGRRREVLARPQPTWKTQVASVSAMVGGCMAILTLIPTLQNMYQLTYPHPAAAQLEPLIYVQTTPYVNTIMDEIAELDRKYHGRHYKISIGVTADATWPFSWYLRDYKNVAYNCTFDITETNDTIDSNRICQRKEVIIAAGDALNVLHAYNTEGKYADNSTVFDYHKYEMRAQGNQGYMHPPCVAQPPAVCPRQQYTGVGLDIWLSWGANPPPNAHFDLGRAAMRIQQWWWQRIPLGRGVESRGDQLCKDDEGAMMAFFIRKDLDLKP